MATDTRRGVSLTPKPRPDRVRLAEAIAATEQQVAATLAARARTRPQDADRLMALSRKAAEAAARERRDAEAYLRQSWNLMSDTERIARQLEMITTRTVRTILAFAEIEDKVAVTFAQLAATQTQHAARLKSLSEKARRQAIQSRQWAQAHSTVGTRAACMAAGQS